MGRQGHRFTGVRGHCEGARLAAEGAQVKLDSGAAARQGKTMQDILDPEACTTMAEVRAGVDAVDRALVALLSRRFGYMDAAARIKPERSMVRDEDRKAQVIANAIAEARALGVPGAPVADIWERLVEASIAYELDTFDRR